ADAAQQREIVRADDIPVGNRLDRHMGGGRKRLNRGEKDDGDEPPEGVPRPTVVVYARHQGPPIRRVRNCSAPGNALLRTGRSHVAHLRVLPRYGLARPKRGLDLTRVAALAAVLEPRTAARHV